jgi:hypothetical protein
VTLVVKETVLGAKEIAVLPSQAQGTVTQEIAQGRRRERALLDEQVRELGGAARTSAGLTPTFSQQ